MTDKFLRICLIVSMLIPLQLTAQESGSFGVNLGIRSTAQLGLTYHVSSAVTLRPEVSFGWWRHELSPGTPGPTSATRTEIGGGFDLLFPVAKAEGITPYFGIGSRLSHIWYDRDSSNESSNRWVLRGLFGVRVKLLERIAAYGEMFAHYGDDSGDYARSWFTIGTSSLGVIVYFD